MKYTAKSIPQIFILLISSIAIIPLFLTAQASGNTTLVPIGASYEEETLSFFSAQALARNTDPTVEIRVLPITYATNPNSITPSERAANLAQANTRASEIEGACQLIITPPTTCNAQVVDIQVKNDAQNPTLVNQINSSIDGVFILGGDQTIAMQVTANTLLETTLEIFYLDGLPIGGTSAGAAVQSRYMIAGYIGSNSAWDALKLGSIDLWYDSLASSERGLSFAFENGVIEQHVLERGRIARLLQATEQLPANHIGIGVDWGTGVIMQNESTLLETEGAYAAVVVDQETYGAAAGAVYVGSDDILSIHNVGFHVLPPGGYGYDLTNRQPLIGGVPHPAPGLENRDYGLTLPPSGAGALFIAGDLATDQLGSVAQNFSSLAQSTGLPAVVFAVGYPTNSAANSAANTWASRLSQLGVSNVQTAPLTTGADLNAIANQLAAAGAIFTVGGNQVTMSTQISLLQNAGIDQVLLQRWQTGGHLLFDNAAAAAVGSWMSAESVPADVEIESSDSFLNGHISITSGLGLLPNVVIEPRFLYDYLYGRLVSHAHVHPEAIGYGIERATAIKITPQEISVLGKMAVMSIDPRQATSLGTGTNNVYAAAWLILDTFPTGEQIPAFGSPPTATPTATATGPTQTPTPTLTPTNTPPPVNNEMHIASIAMSVVPAGNNRFRAQALVTVADANNLPVNGATVTGNFTGDSSGSASGVTNASGQVTLLSPIKQNGANWTFCVTNVTKASWAYNAAANVETCDSTGGGPTAIPTPTLPTPTATPGGSTTMHIGDLDGSSVPGTPGRWDATILITVHDASHNPVAGVTVTGVWSNGATGTSSCITNASGQCSVTKIGTRTTVNSVAFTVTNATHSSLTYQPTSNHDPDGDSNGTAITVNKP
jgi:cyanophycinase